ILTAPPPPRTATLSLHAALPISARLACIRHAASVRPEPGSNSPGKFDMTQRNHGSFSLFSFQGTPSFLFRRLSRRRILSYHGLRRLSTTFFRRRHRNFFLASRAGGFSSSGDDRHLSITVLIPRQHGHV